MTPLVRLQRIRIGEQHCPQVAVAKAVGRKLSSADDLEQRSISPSRDQPFLRAYVTR
jgi:hypothetical protein